MQNTQALERAWDEAADAIEDDPMRLLRYAKCFRYLPRHHKDHWRILEVGCGEGTGLQMLQERGYRNLTGVEVSEERLRRARERLGDSVRLIHVEPDAPLPFDTLEFDAVISAAVIEHVRDVPNFLWEIDRVLDGGGTAIISSDCYSWRILQLLGVYRSSQPIDRAIFPLWLPGLFEEQELHILHAEGFAMSGYEWRFVREIAWVGRAALHKLLHLPSPTPPRFPAIEIVDETWKPRSFVAALPSLICSDENVFWLSRHPRWGKSG